MSKERYELVTASELKVGDVYMQKTDIHEPRTAKHVEYQSDGSIILADSLGCRCYIYAGCEFFRRVPDTDEAAVLRRALELAEKNSVIEDAFGRSCQGPSAQDYIDQAIRELESEAGDEQQGPSRTSPRTHEACKPDPEDPR